MDKTAPQKHIAIVGAGIGGLALAHALYRHGFYITLVEQADRLSEVGSGLGIWENGLEALDAIGLRQSVEARGLPWSKYEILRSNKRACIKDTRILSKDGKTAPLMIKRGHLFGVLKDALPHAINLVTGFKVQNLMGHILKAEDGRQLTADIIIGADGAASIIRKQLTAKTPKFRHQICFRGIASNLGENLTAAEIYDSRVHRIGYFPLPKNQTYWFDIMDSETPNGDFSSVETDLKMIHPNLVELIDKTPRNSILCHPIMDMPPVIMAHEYITLIGDAAHPLQPSLGQGACLALEDAIVLADCLGRHRANPEIAIHDYVLKRKKRWKLYYKLCQQLGASALDKGLLGRQLAILRMIYTPDWSLSVFGRRLFEFRR